MFNLEQYNHKNRLKDIENKITEIEIRNQKLDRDIEELLEDFQVTPEQLTQYLQNEGNFSKKNWKDLERHKNHIEKRLTTELNAIVNPKQTKNAHKERNIGQHWLFVK